MRSSPIPIRGCIKDMLPLPFNVPEEKEHEEDVMSIEDFCDFTIDLPKKQTFVVLTQPPDDGYTRIIELGGRLGKIASYPFNGVPKEKLVVLYNYDKDCLKWMCNNKKILLNGTVLLADTIRPFMFLTDD